MESLMKGVELGWVITFYLKEYNFRLHIQTWLSFYVTVLNVVWKYENTEICGLFTYYLRGIRKISTNIADSTIHEDKTIHLANESELYNQNNLQSLHEVWYNKFSNPNSTRRKWDYTHAKIVPKVSSIKEHIWRDLPNHCQVVNSPVSP